MNRLNLLLSALLVICALGLVTSQHRARKLFVDLEHSRAQARQLEVRWKQLQLDQTRLATASLIDSRARSGLSMNSALPERTLYLTLDASKDRPVLESRR